MILTLDKLFNDNLIISSVIDRVQQTERDRVYWQRYLDFEQTPNRLFKQYIGTVTGVTAGSVIDRNSKKPLRKRRNLGTGVGEVASLGDSYQMDNDRLDMIKVMIDKFNNAGANQGAVMTEIIDYIADDIRQCTLAPHKRMDLVVGALRSTGSASVQTSSNNPNGVSLIDITLPFIAKNPTSGDKTNFLTYLQNTVNELKTSVGTFAYMEMNQATFNKRLSGTAEFQNMYKMILGRSEVAVAGGIVTQAMANELVTAIGLPPIRIVEEYVANTDGTASKTFADERISLLPTEKLGKMMWHQPYESSDPIPGKVYTALSGGHFISTQRTEEGRFIEYGAEWMPNFTAPNKICIINTSSMG